MEETRIAALALRIDDPRRDAMKTPEEVAAMLRLKELGWGAKRIGREFGCSHHTVRRYVEVGGFMAYRQARRARKLDGLEDWLKERFRRHRGNGDVIRQELATEKAIVVSLRTVQRAVAGYRRELMAEARATVRFETAPGRQLQVDFGERLVDIGGAQVKAFLLVATLGYSRRLHVRAFRNERQESWFAGLESSFLAFGGVPEEVLFDNARALVERHDTAPRQVVFNAKLEAFARHWAFRPRACSPYRARTKGKTENGVGYVKKNAIAGRSFASWEAFEAHLEAWTREVADRRLHGTTGEAPIDRFRRDEADRLKPIAGIPPFQAARDLSRIVQNDCAVEVDGNAYSVPWRLIGERVRVTVTADTVRVFHGAIEVAMHQASDGRRQRIEDPAHFEGLVGGGKRPLRHPPVATPVSALRAPVLLRSLAEYEALVGGGF
jgi:transposase